MSTRKPELFLSSAVASPSWTDLSFFSYILLHYVDGSILFNTIVVSIQLFPFLTPKIFFSRKSSLFFLKTENKKLWARANFLQEKHQWPIWNISVKRFSPSQLERLEIISLENKHLCKLIPHWNNIKHVRDNLSIVSGIRQVVFDQMMKELVLTITYPYAQKPSISLRITISLAIQVKTSQ